MLNTLRGPLLSHTARQSVDAAAILPRPKRGARLADSIVLEMVELIVKGDFAQGQLLPPEPVLCELFGVSRTVIRESIRMLDERGLVQVRQGHGSVVSPRSAWNVLDDSVLDALVRHDPGTETLEEIVSLRIVLESHMAAEAALRRTDEDLRSMQELTSAMDPKDEARYLEQDAQFHAAIMTASKNPLASAITRTIMREARNSAKYTGTTDLDHRRASVEDHLALLQAISEQNASAASSEMTRHIYGSYIVRMGRSPSSTDVAVPFVLIASDSVSH